MPFPFNPSHGQIYTTELGVSYKYDATVAAWFIFRSPVIQNVLYQLNSYQFDSPVSSDWTVSAHAPAATDTTYSSLVVRRFDDSTAEGVGFTLKLPEANSITIDINSRPETAPNSSAQVALKLFKRDIPDGSAVGTWTGTSLGSLSITTNNHFKYDRIELSYEALGLTSGMVTQFELVRDAMDPSDTLIGDWDLHTMRIWFK